MKLNKRQKSQLRSLAKSDEPMWGGVSPEYADADLSFFLANRLVEWVGSGYCITPAGRNALDKERG